jgi:hypothetical protein
MSTGSEIRGLLHTYLKGIPKDQRLEFLSWINKEFASEGTEQWLLDLNEQLFACLRGDFEEMAAGGCEDKASIEVKETAEQSRVSHAGAQTLQSSRHAPPPKKAWTCFGRCCGSSSAADIKSSPPPIISSTNNNSTNNISSTKNSTKNKVRGREPKPTIDPKRVEVLVAKLLSDPNFKSGASGALYGIENQIYQMTITTILSTILNNVYAMDGVSIFGFEVELRALKEKERNGQSFETSVPKLGVSRKPIADLVVELLKDEEINLTIIPDEIESRMYENTIMLVLACLQVFFAKNAMRFFGHEIRTSIVPLQGEELSHVLVQRLMAAARSTGPPRLPMDKMEEQIDAFLLMAVGNTGHTWTDSFTLRPLAKALIRLVHRLGNEFMKDLRVSLPGNVIAFDFTRKS